MSVVAKREVARYEVPACIRCGKPIAKGAAIEKWTTPHGKARWVHDGCSPASEWGGGDGPRGDTLLDETAIAKIVRSELDKAMQSSSLSKGGGGLNETAVDLRVNTKLDPVKKWVETVVNTMSGECATRVKHAIDKAEAVEKIGEESKKLYQQTAIGYSVMEKKFADLDKARKVEITIKQPKKPTVKLTDRVHPVFEKVLFHAVTCRENVLLVGPTGCGKTHLAMQIAKAMKCEFGMISCSIGVTESSIFGTREPNEKGGFGYQMSPFATRFRDGGLFLWDEVDALDPNVFLSVNAPLSNHVLHLPKGFGMKPIDRHDDFISLLAANTFGSGADREYVGRNQLDAASLRRVTMIEMDYDEDVERDLAIKIAGSDLGTRLCERLHGYRRKMRYAKLRRFITTGCVEKAATWLSHEKDFDYVDATLFAAWTPSELSKIK